MKTQKVSVDVWAMAKSMIGYVGLAILGGIFLRLIIAALTLPKRLREQKDNVQRAMDELKLKYPDAFKDITEEIESEDKAVIEQKTEDVDKSEQCNVPKSEKKSN